MKLNRKGRAAARRMKALGGPQVFITDVDGCLTDGSFHQNETGRKTHKMFGPDDGDALRLLNTFIPVIIVSADLSGLAIHKTRAEHLGIPFMQASHDRIGFMTAQGYNLSRVVYVGDGWLDRRAVKRVGFGFAPADAWPETKQAADHVTTYGGGHRAVAEAAILTSRRLL